MIKARGTFLKFYVDEKKHHLNVPSPIQKHRESRGRSIEKVRPEDLKLNLNKVRRLDPLDGQQRRTSLAQAQEMDPLNTTQPEQRMQNALITTPSDQIKRSEKNIQILKDNRLPTMNRNSVAFNISQSLTDTQTHQRTAGEQQQLTSGGQRVSCDAFVSGRDAKAQHKRRNRAQGSYDSAHLYSMRQLSDFEKENTVDFMKITNDLSQIYRKRSLKRYDFSHYFDLNNFGIHDNYDMKDLIANLKQEQRRQYKEQKQIQQCTELLKQLKKKRTVENGFHSVIRSQKKHNENVLNDYQDTGYFQDLNRRSVDQTPFYDSNNFGNLGDGLGRLGAAGAGRTATNFGKYATPAALRKQKTRSDINRAFQQQYIEVRKDNISNQNTEDKSKEEERSTASNRMPKIQSHSIKQIKANHLRQSMNIINDAEHHLRSLKRKKQGSVEEIDPKDKYRMLEPLQLSREDQDILGVESPLPKIDEDSSEPRQYKYQRQDTFLEEKEDLLRNQKDSVEKLYAQELIKSITEAFPNSKIPVINMDSYIVEKSLDKGRTTQMAIGSTWTYLEKDSNHKNPYIQNRKMTKKLQKNIQSIAKQSSRVAQQRLMRSVNEALASKQRQASVEDVDKNQEVFREIARRGSSMSIKLLEERQTESRNAKKMSHMSIGSANLSPSSKMQQKVVEKGVSGMGLITDASKDAGTPAKKKIKIVSDKKKDGGVTAIADTKKAMSSTAKTKQGQSVDYQEQTPAQYRAKQVEMMNPFCTFFNQMQTKNKRHDRTVFLKFDQKDQFDMINIEQDLNLQSELVKMVAIHDYDDLAMQKYAIGRKEHRDHNIAQAILQIRAKQRLIEQTRDSQEQEISKEQSKNDVVGGSKTSILSRKGRRHQFKKKMTKISEGEDGFENTTSPKMSTGKNSQRIQDDSKLETAKQEQEEQKLSDDQSVSLISLQSDKKKKSVKRPDSISTENQMDLMSHNSTQSFSKLGKNFSSYCIENKRAEFIKHLDSVLPNQECPNKACSIFNMNCIRNVYPILKMVKMAEFHQQYSDMDISYDFDKLVFIEQIEYFLQNSIEAFLAKDQDALVQNMVQIAYLGLFKIEYQVVMKVYNLLGHTFMVWKKYQEAYDYFKKLRDTSKMGGDIETSMYAFKQIGHCLMNMNDKHKALKAFKCQLQVAWHLNHYLGELSSFENIAITYFYLGKIEKAKYYIDRFYRGKTEAMFSAVKKISLGFTRRRYKRINPIPFKSDEFQQALKGGQKGQQKLSKNTKELFCKNLKNYALINEEILKSMGFLKKKKKFESIFTDPTGQYIDQGSPISNVSLRNLPSPSEVKGQSHLLLMPFYQEIGEEENKKVAANQNKSQQNRGPQSPQESTAGGSPNLKLATVKNKLNEDSGDEKSESSDEGVVFDSDFLHQKRKVDKNGIILRKFAVNRDELLVTVVNDTGRKSHFGPMNAIRVKQQEKMRHEARVSQIRQEQLKKEQKKRIQAQMELLGDNQNKQGQPQKSKQTVDMDAVIARANAQSHTGSNKQLYLSHQSNKRPIKYAKEIEDSHVEQVKFAYMEMLELVKEEKQRVFVSRKAYELHFRDQTPYTTIPPETNQQYGFIEDFWANK